MLKPVQHDEKIKMQKIYQLPQHVISRIAAGEVIERPVYAVKELIENAIDAGADMISLQIEEAGLKKIVVADNGEGMSPEDLAESFKPHTTSKIKEDLDGIKTMGFRGEALSSIASVSHMTIQSRLAHQAAGATVTLRAGQVEHTGPVGMAPGTIITVSHLFHTVPARKKFLKSTRTELHHIIELVTQYALSYPQIRFSLTHNNRKLFDFPKDDVLSRLTGLFGTSFASQLFPIKTESSYITVGGYIGHPQVTSSTKQHIFINNRVVTDKLITAAVKEAYGNLLEPKAYPVFVLSLALPHEVVDVNVHPRKEQVRFVNNTMIFDAVKTAVGRTLSDNNLTFYNASFTTFSVRGGTTASHAAKVLKQTVEPWNVKDLAKLLKTSDVIQVHKLYLLLQSPLGVLLIDQHAAHERILYEQFLQEFKKQKKKIFTLPKPLHADFSPAEISLLDEYKKLLKEMGFVFTIDGNTVAFTAVPDLFKDRDIKMLVIEFLEELSSGKSLHGVDTISNRMIAYLACRTAIKAGDTLTKPEAKRLIERLTETNSPYTCPHGRPTQVELTMEEMNGMFKR